LLAFNIAFSALHDVEAAPLIVPDWANQAVLNNAGALQSVSNSGGTSRAGYKEVVTSDLKTLTSMQITWAVRPVNTGDGLNVTVWNPYIEVRSLNTNSSAVIATIPLNIHSFFNMDGSPVQTTTVGSNTTFVSPINYGTSSGGLQNFVLYYTLTGNSLINFQQNLVVGQEAAFFLVTSANSNVGTPFTLASPNLFANGASKAIILFGQDISALPTQLSTAGIGFAIHPVNIPGPSITLLQLSSSIVGQQFITCLSTANDSLTYKILRSTDLNDWSPCATFTGNGQTFQHVEPLSGRAFFKAYRMD
jgi:hypothetical protein